MAVVAIDHQRFEHPAAGLPKIGLQPAGLLAQPQQGFVHLGVVGPQDAQQFVANSIAGVEARLVGRIVTKGDGVGLGELLDLAAAQAEHRADQADGAAVADGPGHADPAEPANAGAADDPLQDGLHVVIRVVSQGHRVAVELEAEPFHELVAALPAGELDGDALGGGPFTDLRGFHRAGHLEAAGLLGDELGVAIGLDAAKPMVEVGHVQGGGPALPLAQAAQHGEQDHGVNPAGDRHDQRLFASQQAAFDQGLHTAGFKFIGHRRLRLNPTILVGVEPGLNHNARPLRGP